MPDSAREYAISTSGLTKVFGRFTAVDRVSFDVGRGEIFGMLGPNGAGKSTTIRMLCGLLGRTSGNAVVGGFDPTTQPEKVRQNIGYMSQKFSLYKDLTVTENLTFFGGIYGIEGARLKRRIGEVLEETALSAFAGQLTGTLSGAVQQRLALANAVLHEPQILVLDEPTSGVDPISRRNFWDLIRSLTRRGVTALVTTHFMDEAEFCGRIGFITRGRLIAAGTPASVKSSAVKEDVFEVEVPPAAGTREELERLDGVTAVSYFGARMHMFVEKGLHSEISLLQLIKGKGFKVQSAKRIEVTLEDAFIRMAAQGTERTA